VQFTVHSDGNVTDVSVIEGGNLKLLSKISMDALTSPAPFKPFDEALLKQVGSKYTDDFSFSNNP
jgi:outer membrane biosynthesis protein TonB